MVLSPTCRDCLAGYALTVASVADNVDLLTLWTAMLPGDSVDAVSALMAQDPHGRTEHFWESVGWPVSSRLRPLLGLGAYDPQWSAWDVYLLYQSGRIWTGDTPGVPDAWAHNLQPPPSVGEPISDALLRNWSA